MSATLFEAGEARAVEIESTDVGMLQRYYESNPEYSERVEGEPPRANLAVEHFADRPPAEWLYTRRWLLRFETPPDPIVAVADVVSDLIAANVWHIGLFHVATRLHGSGVAATLYDALEGWMKACGALWIRLGVVEGNVRAERFWARRGYVEMRKRHGLEMGRRTNTVRVLAKAVSDAGLDEYLRRVARDRPEERTA